MFGTRLQTHRFDDQTFRLYNNNYWVLAAMLLFLLVSVVAAINVRVSKDCCRILTSAHRR